MRESILRQGEVKPDRSNGRAHQIRFHALDMQVRAVHNKRMKERPQMHQ